MTEADLNASYKEVFGNRMLDMVRSHGFTPEEIYSDKGKTADDCYLAKFILYTIFWQARTSTALNSIYAANCCDSIAYEITSLVFQTFGVPLEAVESMLSAIEEMRYFLTTAYGDSKKIAGGTIEIKFQGFCQGRGAAPEGWAVTIFTIICAHKRKAWWTLCVSYL